MFILELVIELAIDAYISLGFGTKEYRIERKMEKLSKQYPDVLVTYYHNKSIFHIQHVNAYHQQLKKWMERCNGVGTKCIENCLFWFRFLKLHKQLDKKLRKHSNLFNC